MGLVDSSVDNGICLMLGISLLKSISVQGLLGWCLVDVEHPSPGEYPDIVFCCLDWPAVCPCDSVLLLGFPLVSHFN